MKELGAAENDLPELTERARVTEKKGRQTVFNDKVKVKQSRRSPTAKINNSNLSASLLNGFIPSSHLGAQNLYASNLTTHISFDRTLRTKVKKAPKRSSKQHSLLHKPVLSSSPRNTSNLSAKDSNEKDREADENEGADKE